MAEKKAGAKPRPAEKLEPRDTLLARRLTHLYKTVKPENGKKAYSDQDVVAGICAATGDPDFIGRTHLYHLRTGRSDNPTYKLLIELARFFRVSPSYFFPDEELARGELSKEAKAVLSDDTVRDLALEAAGLSGPARDAVRQMIANMRAMGQTRD